MSYNQASTTEQRPITSSCSLNSTFLRSPPGILKLIELVIDIIIWICVGATRYFSLVSNGAYINFAATITFIFTLILLILYLFQFIHRLPGPWILIECISILLSIFFLVIAMIIGAVSFEYGSGTIAAAVFCALNAVVYSFEMFLRFRIHRSGGFNFTVTAVDGDASIKETRMTTTTEVTETHEKQIGHVEFVDKYGVP